MADPPASLSDNLYALLVHLHVTATADLLAAMHTSNLSAWQLELLDRLANTRRRPTLAQAASMMHLSSSAASRAIDQLARRGLVLRHVDDNDFRRKRIEITPEGREMIRRLHAAQLPTIVAFTASLSDDEREQLDETLELLARRQELAACRPDTAAA